jgi:hypothetical protein
MLNIGTIIQHLKDIRWTWSKLALEPVLTALGATHKEGVIGRCTYSIEAGSTLSVYYHDDQIEFLEFTVDVFFEPHLLSAEEYEQKVDEYFEKYEIAVGFAERILGPPVFNDGRGNNYFPEDQEAVWLAQWNLPNARLMIQQKHEDKELPFRLCIVIAPPFK